MRRKLTRSRIICGLGQDRGAGAGTGPSPESRAPATLREYLAHRRLREEQILAGLAAGPARVAELVERIYTDVPRVLHPAAAHSVAAHLRKLEREGRVRRSEAGAVPLMARWLLS